MASMPPIVSRRSGYAQVTVSVAGPASRSPISCVAHQPSSWSRHRSASRVGRPGPAGRRPAPPSRRPRASAESASTARDPAERHDVVDLHDGRVVGARPAGPPVRRPRAPRGGPARRRASSAERGQRGGRRARRTPSPPRRRRRARRARASVTACADERRRADAVGRDDVAQTGQGGGRRRPAASRWSRGVASWGADRLAARAGRAGRLGRDGVDELLERLGDALAEHVEVRAARPGRR